MCYWLSLALLASALHLADPRDSRALEELDTVGLIRAFGWRSEEHTVQTDDGYVLKMYRLRMRSPADQDWRPGRGPPVIMVAGIFERADCFVIRGPDKDLAFLLVKAGFDVWLGDYRGTPSTGAGHVSLGTEDPAFWDYSWHEMGYYDVPAMIDYVLGRTGALQVMYIGHSMGSTMFFAMAASRPEFNSKVRVFVGLAPVVLTKGPYGSHYKALGQYRANILAYLKKYNVDRLLPLWFRRVIPNYCRDNSPSKAYCRDAIFTAMGINPKLFNLNESLVPMIMAHSSVSSSRTFAHYVQNVYSGRFQQADLGPEENLRKYGSAHPPDYDISRVSAPVALYYSTNDPLSFEQDVLNLAKKLPRVLRVYKVPDKAFNHLDFLYAEDSYSLLYKDIIQLLLKMKSSICY